MLRIGGEDHKIHEGTRIPPEWYNAIQEEVINAILYGDKDAVFDGSDNKQLLKAIQKLIYFGGVPLVYDLKNDSRLEIAGIELDEKKARSVSFIAHGVASTAHVGFKTLVTLNQVAFNPFSKKWTLHSLNYSSGDRLYYLSVSEGGGIACEIPDICRESFEGRLTISQIKYVGA